MEAEVRKSTKYAELMPAYEFCLFVVETLGTWGPEAQALAKEIGKRISELTGEPRSASFLRQQIDVALERDNAASILGTMAHHSKSKE